MKIEVTEVKKIESGKHVGNIVAVEYRTQPFNYTDLVIELANGMKLKAGFPTVINRETKLGKLLMKFGAVMESGTTIDPEQYLVGERVEFLTMDDVTSRGTFAKVVDGSITPVSS